jgi:hypothetical protein
MRKKKSSLKKVVKTNVKHEIVDTDIKKKKVSTSKKIEISEEELEQKEITNVFKPINKVFPPSTVCHLVFSNIPSDKKISRDTDTGSRVIVAKYPNFYKIYFVEYIEAGKPSFPRGGVKVYNQTFDQMQYFYYESVALHPTKKEKCRIIE